uniref:Uncharacterized protein n=1 Tax=Megaviridae environmental sample TaxID=1737588 RepID=A0A5J6VP67_9VIRU|nr:MAG: hypothetical protein [Megaviridae environmental sample]
MVNLLVSILTSGQLHYLKECVKSVQNQLGTKLQYSIHINVNSTNEDYYDEVKTTFPDMYVFKTESNGKPGKGHNSNLAHFKKQKKYTLLLPLDGDDFLYPYALKRLEYYLAYNPDVLILPYNDMLNDKYPDNCLSAVIDDKCYFNYNNFVDNMRDNWLNQKKNPLTNNINTTNTGGRLFLISKRGLKINLEYTETLGIYDDTVPFLQILEYYNLYNDLNIYILEDVDMYLYNKINQGSVTHVFDPQKDTSPEETNFREAVKHKFLSIRDFKIAQFKFLKTDPLPEFSAIDKFNFARRLVSNIQLETKSHKYDNYKLFISHAVGKKNADMLRIYVKQYLICTSVYNKEDIEHLKRFLLSYALFTDANDAINVTIFTLPSLKPIIENLLQLLHIKSNVIANIKQNTPIDRLLHSFHLESVPNINIYNKVIYLKPYTIFNKVLEPFLNSMLEDKLYAFSDNDASFSLLKLQNKESIKCYNDEFLMFNNTKTNMDFLKSLKIYIQLYIKQFNVKEEQITDPFLSELFQYFINKHNMVDDIGSIEHMASTYIHFDKKDHRLINIHKDSMDSFMNLKTQVIENKKPITDDWKDRYVMDTKVEEKTTSVFIDFTKEDLYELNELSYVYKEKAILKFNQQKDMFVYVDVDTLDITNGGKYVPISKELLLLEHQISDHNKEVFKEYKHIEYTEEQMDSFMQIHKLSDEYKKLCENYEKTLIKELKHMMFIVLHLYLNGGVYLSNIVEIDNTIHDILKDASVVFCKSIKLKDGLNNVCIATGPKTELFKYYIKLFSEITEAKLITNKDIIDEQLHRVLHMTKTPNAAILDVSMDNVSTVENPEDEENKEALATNKAFCQYIHNDVNILKYYFVTEVLPDKEKNIFIGPSTTDNMTITLEKPMKIGNTPLNKQHPMWDTTFEVEVEGLEVTIKKSEENISAENPGWKQHLVLPVLQD